MTSTTALTSINFNVSSTEHGIYEANCGLDKVLMSWGHDGKWADAYTSQDTHDADDPDGNAYVLPPEYLYRVLKFNNCSIPEEVNINSFFPSYATYLLTKMTISCWIQNPLTHSWLVVIRACTWSAFIPSTPGTPMKTTCTCAVTKTCRCCPGSKSSSKTFP